MNDPLTLWVIFWKKVAFHTALELTVVFNSEISELKYKHFQIKNQLLEAW